MDEPRVPADRCGARPARAALRWKSSATSPGLRAATKDEPRATDSREGGPLHKRGRAEAQAATEVVSAGATWTRHCASLAGLYRGQSAAASARPKACAAESAASSTPGAQTVIVRPSRFSFREHPAAAPGAKRAAAFANRPTIASPSGAESGSLSTVTSHAGTRSPIHSRACVIVAPQRTPQSVISRNPRDSLPSPHHAKAGAATARSEYGHLRAITELSDMPLGISRHEPEASSVEARGSRPSATNCPENTEPPRMGRLR
jgi:hypothetical protein